MIKVFIVGSAGTTGLRLSARLKSRDDIEIIEIDDKLRKDSNEIRRLMSLSDYTFLCLPDTAAIKMSELAKDTNTRLIDTSTAHRTSDLWAYGFPELSEEHRNKIKTAEAVASPGCHASGFVSLIYPLISAGVISKEVQLSCTSLTGYSGGGKQMIAEYQSETRNQQLCSPKLYGMEQNHKHLPEIIKQCSLTQTPIFMPIVGDYYSGMLVSIGIHAAMLSERLTPNDLRKLYKKHYAGSKLISVLDSDDTSLYSNQLSGRDDMEIFVGGNDERILLSSRFDNLGKGASGAAIQCLNIMCGLPEEKGLIIKQQ